MADLQISENGLNLIKKFEGLRLTAYQDSIGVWTIGYGHTSGVFKGMQITNEQATAFLFEDVQKVVKFLNKKNRIWTQNQFDALVSFGFNCGTGNLNKLITDRPPYVISEKILQYNKAGGKVLNGLTNRRKAEKLLFDTQSTVNANSIQNEGKSKTSKGFVKLSNPTSHLNLRKSPSMTAEVVALLDNNDSLIFDDSFVSSTWYKVTSQKNNKSGYVDKRYVAKG